jgi:hypothetical protein
MHSSSSFRGGMPTFHGSCVAISLGRTFRTFHSAVALRPRFVAHFCKF